MSKDIARSGGQPKNSGPSPIHPGMKHNPDPSLRNADGTAAQIGGVSRTESAELVGIDKAKLPDAPTTSNAPPVRQPG
jgi:hypothetical protein